MFFTLTISGIVEPKTRLGLKIPLLMSFSKFSLRFLRKLPILSTALCLLPSLLDQKDPKLPIFLCPLQSLCKYPSKTFCPTCRFIQFTCTCRKPPVHYFLAFQTNENIFFVFVLFVFLPCSTLSSDKLPVCPMLKVWK